MTEVKKSGAEDVKKTPVEQMNIYDVICLYQTALAKKEQDKKRRPKDATE